MATRDAIIAERLRRAEEARDQAIRRANRLEDDLRSLVSGLAVGSGAPWAWVSSGRRWESADGRVVQRTLMNWKALRSGELVCVANLDYEAARTAGWTDFPLEVSLYLPEG